MVVELRSLRIVSDFSAEKYVSGMNEKIAADRAGVASSKAAGAAIEEQKIKVSSAVPLIEKLSRSYVDGYGTAAKFNTEMLKLARSQDSAASTVEHLELVYTGLQKKFGLIADATELQRRGYTQLAAAIENVNTRLNQSGGAEKVSAQAARIEQLRLTLDPAYVSAQRLSAELAELAEAERLGVQITGGYERALDAIILKHDATAAAARRQRDEYARLAQEGREAASADRAQASFNQQLGMFGGTGLRASDSASVFAEQLSRQEELARLRMQQQADQFSADLRRRFTNDNPTSARDSASVFSAEFDRVDELSRLRSQQQGAGFTQDLNQRLGVNGFGTSARASAQAFEEAARAAEDLDRRTASLRAQIDPVGAAQARLNAELAEYDMLASKAKISTEELAQAHVLARQKFDATAKEIDRQGKTGVRGLPSYQATNLLYQGTDVVQSLALGMPLIQVFLQQGPQIAQIFYQAEGSMQALLGLINPVAVGLTAITAAALLGAKAWNDYLTSIKAVETAAAGLGRGTAGTAEQMETAARAGADAANISITSARAMEAQFLRTGRIGYENFESLISISKDFGATIGVDADKAGAALAEMFADPGKAADTLFRQYGLINGATAEYARRLAAQNQISEAQAVLLDALPNQLASAAEATTALGRAWESVAKNASDAWDAVGKAIDTALSADDRLTGSALNKSIADAESRLKSIRAGSILDGLYGGTNARAGGVRADLDVLYAMRNRELEAEERRRQAARDRQDAINASVAVGIADNSPATADRRRREELEDQIRALRDQRSSTNISAQQGASIDIAIEAKTRALDGLINRQQRSLELDRLDIQIQNERNPLLRAELEARRTRVQMSDQEIASYRISEEAQRARTRVIEETIAAGAAQSGDMQIELGFRTRLNDLVEAGNLTRTDANRLLQEEVSLRPLMAAAAMAEGQERERLLQVIDQLRTAYAGLAEEQKRSAAIDYLTSLNERMEQLRLEASLLGENEMVRGRANAALEAEQRIRRIGLDPGSELADRIRAETDALAEQTREVERQAEAWKKVQSATESALDGAIDKLAEGDLKGALKTAADDLRKMVLELGVKNVASNGLLGTDKPTLSDVGGFSGIIARLFGGSKADPASLAKNALSSAVGTMSVTAGAVVVNGGIGGGLPGVSRLQSPANSNDPFKAILGDGSGGLKAAGATRDGIALSEIVAANGMTAKVSSQYAGRFQGLLNDLKAAGYNITSLGEGGYSYRNVAGTGKLSRHAFGEALDINPRQNPWSHNFQTDMPSNINELARRNGLTWGGTWRKPDTMHFQVDPSIKPANEAALAFTRVARSADATTQGLGTFGGGLNQIGSALSQFPAAPQGGAGGGGLFGWLGKLFSSPFIPNGAQATFAASGGIGLYANGGVSDRPAIFGEGPLPEAAVPLPDGRRIPVQLNLQGSMGRSRTVSRTTNFYNAPAGYDVTVEDEDDGQGNEKTNVVFSKVAANEAQRHGSPLNKTLRAMGARAPRRKR